VERQALIQDIINYSFNIIIPVVILHPIIILIVIRIDILIPIFSFITIVILIVVIFILNSYCYSNSTVLKMPGFKNSPLRANIVINIFYKSLLYFTKQKLF
jgi:hypothetical protein